ncbi:glycosyltransferase family 1 protein [soil metagenome]
MPLDLLGIDASRATTSRKTGVEWYSREIIQAMAATEDRPKLRLYQRDPERFLDAADIEWVHVDRRRFWTHAGLAFQFRRSKVDALFVPSHVIPWRHPGVTVVTIHDLGYRHEPGAHTLRRRAVLELTTRWNARVATRIITPSTATRDDLTREYGIDPARVVIVPHGVDHRRFRTLEPNLVNNALHDLGVRQPYILFASTIQPRKNLANLISAFEDLGNTDLQLVIAGTEGWMAKQILTRIDSSTRTRDIIRLGYVADDSLAALYNGAEAFVFPSLYEGFGMGVLEAMACGCPVVTSSGSSLPEVAGDAAILVDPRSARDIRDGIERALYPNQAGDLRAKGLQRAAGFSWPKAARQTLDVIGRAYDDDGG